jgi:uncharacterized membrane protein
MASVRSGQGNPAWSLKNPVFPLLSVLLGSGMVFFIILGVVVIISKKSSREPDDPGETAVPLPETDLISLEEKIIQLLKTTGGEQYRRRW